MHRDALLVLVSLVAGTLIGRHSLAWTTPRCIVAHTGAGLRTEQPWTTVEPSCDLNRSEANYHRQQQAALGYLQSLARVRPHVDMWYLNGPFYECPGRRRMGRLIDGGKWVCAPEQLLSHAACVVYSVGSNGEASFEAAILADFPHCRVHTFDPTLTPTSAAKVRRVPGVDFHPQGITSAKELPGTGSNFTTLADSMAAANVTWIDVLKIDIEGGEWGVFLELLDTGAQMPFTQILIEIHSDKINGGPTGATAKRILTRFFTGMHAAGYRVFSVEPNYLAAWQCLEYAFIKVDGSGHFIRGV